MRPLLALLLLALPLAAQNPETAAYPSAVASDDELLCWKNGGTTQLNGAINDSTLTVVVDDASNLCAPGVITIDSERMKVASISTNTLTIASGGRGFDGSSAASHSDNAAVSAFVPAYWLNQLAAEVIAIETALGANLSNVGGGGGGDVTASSSFGADNVLIRSDGTGKGVQASGITVDDSDNVTIPGGVTMGTASGTPFVLEGATADAFETTIALVDPTADRTWTIPDSTDTFAGLATTQTLTNKTLTAPTLSGAITGSGTHYYDFPEITAPSSPSANTARFYSKDNGSGTTQLCYKDSGGTETCIGSGSGSSYIELFYWLGGQGTTAGGFSTTNFPAGVFSSSVGLASGTGIQLASGQFQDADAEIAYFRGERFATEKVTSGNLSHVNFEAEVSIQTSTLSNTVSFFLSIACIGPGEAVNTAFSSLTYTSLTAMTGTSTGTAGQMFILSSTDQDITTPCSVGDVPIYKVEADETSAGMDNTVNFMAFRVWTD